MAIRITGLGYPRQLVSKEGACRWGMCPYFSTPQGQVACMSIVMPITGNRASNDFGLNTLKNKFALVPVMPIACRNVDVEKLNIWLSL